MPEEICSTCDFRSNCMDIPERCGVLHEKNEFYRKSRFLICAIEGRCKDGFIEKGDG